MERRQAGGGQEEREGALSKEIANAKGGCPATTPPGLITAQRPTPTIDDSRTDWRLLLGGLLQGHRSGVRGGRDRADHVRGMVTTTWPHQAGPVRHGAKAELRVKALQQLDGR